MLRGEKEQRSENSDQRIANAPRATGMPARFEGRAFTQSQVLRPQPLWQLGHCLASNRSGVTGNMLLHWMQTRWRTELTTAPGCTALIGAAGCDSAVFSGLVSVDMAGF